MSQGTKAIRINEHVRLDKRERSSKWQARVKLADGSWHRFSTKTEDQDKAAAVAMKFFYTAEDRLKNKLPQSTRKFRRVAVFARDRMQSELDAGGGNIVFKDYITAIDKYLIPYFGNYDVASINTKSLIEFGKWRTQELGRKAHHSTINTHNTALNRVLDEAEQRGWITHAIRPKPINDGTKTESRGSFTLEEYETIYKGLRSWPKATSNEKTYATREVLRNYVLILANTGMRHGTEALNLKWNNLLWVNDGKDTYLGIYVDGKTGKRPLIARDRAKRPFERQIELSPQLSGKTLDEVIDAKIDDYVFKTRDDERAARANLSRNFESFLKANNLSHGADGKKRTLYSWRHFYATLDLQRGVSTHALSRQMGSGTGVIDRFYSKLSPFMNAAQHSGRADQDARDAVKEDAEVSAANTVFENTSANTVEKRESPALSATEKAFDLFDAGTLSEPALLAALGVARDEYKLSEDLRLRALAAFEEERLSEEGLIKVLH
ncbi:Phage integrase family protein [Shimia gijangensis]|uniref:Phage integrase family protein n=1 Tax=Shimia gijangensis TaxID=1470563 RepID=A0A1M6SWR9_9RHOB|nr:site-specific integrase [Shimia gijangensis]SHK49107.1 Phage integrase family protein [Shimia gijangensis]